MKKRMNMILFAVFLLAILVYGFFNTTSKSQKNQSKSNHIRLGVLQLVSHPALDSIYQGLTDELKALGYVAGRNLTIDLQNAQGEQSNLATMSQKLVSAQNDILVGITTPATLALSNTTKDIPIIMGGITYPVEAGLIQSENKPGNNITGVSDRTPVQQQLELMKQVLPNLKKVGILYTSSEDNSTKQAKLAINIAKNLGLEVVERTVTNTNDVEQVTENLASSVDAIFIPIDNTLASTMATVTKITDRYGKPVFPSSDTMVADGGLMGIGVDQYQIGVQTARVVIAVLNGEKPADKPIVLAQDGVIYYNDDVAKRLDIALPDDLKTKVTLVTPTH